MKIWEIFQGFCRGGTFLVRKKRCYFGNLFCYFGNNPFGYSASSRVVVLLFGVVLELTTPLVLFPKSI